MSQPRLFLFYANKLDVKIKSNISLNLILEIPDQPN